MKKIKLEEGKCYYQTSDDWKFITLYIPNEEQFLEFDSDGNVSYQTGGDSTSTEIVTEREATLEEEFWLRACISAGKFIPQEELKIGEIGKTLRPTKDQFECVLKFLAIFGTDILQHSPDYIIEKYERFIGPITDNIDGEVVGGVHPILQKGVVETYLKLWQPIFKES